MLADYDPINVHGSEERLLLFLTPTAPHEYHALGQMDDHEGAWRYAYYTSRTKTAGQALDGFLALHNQVTTPEYTPLLTSYRLDVSIWLRKEKRSVTCTIECAGFKKPWLIRGNDRPFDRPGEALDTWLEDAFGEDYSTYAWGRGTVDVSHTREGRVQY